jgi:hypothetical protein
VNAADSRLDAGAGESLTAATPDQTDPVVYGRPVVNPFGASASLLSGYSIVLAATWATIAVRGGRKRAWIGAPLVAVIGATGSAGAGAALVALVSLLTGYSPPHPVTVVLMVLALLLGGVAGGFWLTPPPPDDRFKRGATLEPVSENRRATKACPREIRFAGIRLEAADETKHFKLIGTTGTGKSTAIRALLGAALARGDRAVIADPDGGYLARFHDARRGDVILNPFDERSLAWDPFRELRAPQDYDQLARSLVGEGAGAEESWRGYAQTLVSALLRRLHRVDNRSVGELHRLLTAASHEELRLLLDGSPAQPFLDPGNERMFGSIRAVASTRTTALDYVRLQRTPAFSVRDWVATGTGSLFLPYQADQIAALRTMISTWLRIAIFQTMSQGEGDHRLWFVIDELDAIGAIDGLKDALARLRKFGGRCVLGFQSIAQVSALYGNSDAQTIVENCGNTLILRCSASEQGGTARFASRLIGEREIVRESVQYSAGGFAQRFGGSTSVSRQHLTEALVLPSEIERLPDLSGYAKTASRPAWTRVRLAEASSA